MLCMYVRMYVLWQWIALWLSIVIYCRVFVPALKTNLNSIQHKRTKCSGSAELASIDNSAWGSSSKRLPLPQLVSGRPYLRIGDIPGDVSYHCLLWRVHTYMYIQCRLLCYALPRSLRSCLVPRPIFFSVASWKAGNDIIYPYLLLRTCHVHVHIKYTAVHSK